MSDQPFATPETEPSYVLPSTYNDILLATSRPPRSGAEWYRPITLPPPAIPGWEIKEGDLDVTYLRTLPEFEHWKTYGWVVVRRDLDLLESERMTLLDLFGRGPVSPSWYMEMDRVAGEGDEERLGEAEGGFDRKDDRAYRFDNAEGTAESSRVTKDTCPCRVCHDSARTVRTPMGTRELPRGRQSARRGEYKSPVTADADPYRALHRDHTPQPRSSRLVMASATPAAEEPRRMRSVIYLSHSPSSILQEPSIKDFAIPGTVDSRLLGLYCDVRVLEGLARSYRQSYEKIWAEMADDREWFRGRPILYSKARNLLESDYSPERAVITAET